MIKIKKFYNCLKNINFYKAYLKGVAPLFELTDLVQKIDNANTLIDIGSNKGQFSLIARKFFPGIKIYSFEPQLDELNIQKKILGDHNINYYNLALGSEEKILNLYITKRRDSSSLLEPNYQINKKKIYSTSEIIKTKVKKLDNIISTNGIIRPLILKLDVQGYELEVLKGSINLLKYIDYIITEISFIKIYNNQVSKKELTNFLLSNNFKFKSKCNLSKLNEQLFQEDVLFVKDNI